MADELNVPHRETLDVTGAKDYYHLPLLTSAKGRAQEPRQAEDQPACTDEGEGAANPPRGHSKSSFLLR